MQSQEPPGHARHRRQRTDPPVPPRMAADYVSHRGGDALPASSPPPPWAHDRADPEGRLQTASAPPDGGEGPGPSAGWSPAFTESVGSVDDPPTVWPPPGPAAGPAPEVPVAAVPERDAGVRGRPYTEVADSTDLATAEDSGTGHRSVTGTTGGARDTVPEQAGHADPPFGAYAASTRLRGAPPTPTVSADDRPGGPLPRPVPRPRPSPGPRRPASDVVDDGRAPGGPRAPEPAPDVPGPAAPRATGPDPAGPDTGAPHSRETTGPVLDRPIRDDHPGGTGGRDRNGGVTTTGAHAAAGTPPRTGPPRDRVTASGSHRATGSSAGTVEDVQDPPTDTDPGADEVAPRRRRTLRPDLDRSRTVSDVARERGLPVRELAEPAAAPGTGHGHGHGHTPATPAGRRVRILLAALLVPCALAALAGVALLWPGASPVPAVPPQQQVNGTVQAVQASDCTPGTGSGGCTGVTVRMTDGPRAGSDLVQLVPAEPSTPRFAVGDAVVMGYSGGNPDEAGSYQITDFQRGMPLAWLAAAFALAVLVLGRWRGLAALVALGLSFAVLVWFVLPSILSGNNPLAVAVTGAGVIMFVVLYLSHGFSARTSCAVLGTLVSLALIGGLGALFTATTRLTGLDDTTSNLIGTIGTVSIDARGLLLAGLVIGALGVLDDVTVTQASAVWELRDANPSLRAGTLFAAGMRIGRDHVSSAVNTLVLAYAGAALPLMLLFTVSSASFGQVVTSQDVATEIVRTLVGSIGLVASVPLTTGLAAVVAARR